MIIATGADDRFAMPLAVTLYSALANMRRGVDIDIYIFDGGISDENRQKLHDTLKFDSLRVRLEWVKPDLALLQGLKTTQAFSQAAYLRLLIPDSVPQSVDRILYLDSDLVVETDLMPLWEMEMGSFPALAVPDYRYPYVSCLGWGETYAMRDLAPRTPYCNTGVLLMNLRQWRTQEVSIRALEYIREFPQFVRFADQDGINAVLAGTWGLLDDRWNVMLSMISHYGRRSGMSEAQLIETQQELLREPFVLHFAGQIKPWRFEQRGRFPLRFFHYLRQSGWFGSFEDVDQLMEHTWAANSQSDEWAKMLNIDIKQLASLIPNGSGFILVDQCSWPTGVLEDRYPVPFPERNGDYAGIPQDDAAAIREFERMRESGAKFIVFADPALWWLDYFSEFNRHLRQSFRCILENDRLIGFDLRCRFVSS